MILKCEIRKGIFRKMQVFQEYLEILTNFQTFLCIFRNVQEILGSIRQLWQTQERFGRLKKIWKYQKSYHVYEVLASECLEIFINNQKSIRSLMKPEYGLEMTSNIQGCLGCLRKSLEDLRRAQDFSGRPRNAQNSSGTLRNCYEVLENQRQKDLGSIRICSYYDILGIFRKF